MDLAVFVPRMSTGVARPRLDLPRDAGFQMRDNQCMALFCNHRVPSQTTTPGRLAQYFTASNTCRHLAHGKFSKDACFIAISLGSPALGGASCPGSSAAAIACTPPSGAHRQGSGLLLVTMKRPGTFQDTFIRDTRCHTTATMAVLQCTAIHHTKEALAESHHPTTVPMTVCPYAAIGPNEAPTPPLAALASVASGMDDLASDSSGKTRLTYSALAALASVASGGLDDMMMPRVPDETQGDSSDGPQWCSVCMMWLNGTTQCIDHLVGKKHRQSFTLKRKECGQRAEYSASSMSDMS